MVRFLKANFETLPGLLPEVRHHLPAVYAQGPIPALLSDLGVRPIPEAGVEDGALVLLLDSPTQELVYLVDRLLGPGGCPWDQEQTHESLKRCLLEEAYEVLDAIDQGDPNLLEEELGDLLLQPVMHAQMQKLAGSFDTDDVAARLVRKLVERHPHVFGTMDAPDTEAVLRNWEKIKAAEKTERSSVLDGVPNAAPSLMRAQQISRKAARVGFEWPNLNAVFDKLREEESELREAVEDGRYDRIEAEVGDLLFTVVNLARWLKVDSEDALRMMVDRFEARFRHMESAAGVPLTELSPEIWEELWSAAKQASGG